ncbi:MAG: hypothetical protein Kow0067_00550 [Coriobacteriia bacterium]
MTDAVEITAAPGPVRGLALRCAEDGTVIEVISGGVMTDQTVIPGAQLRDLVSAESREKAEAFLAELQAGSSTFDWEMTVSKDGRPLPLRFSGVPTEAGALVIAVASRGDLLVLLEQFVEMNNELLNTVRSLRKEQSSRRGATDAEGFAELSRLNNDLVNLQRELTKKNAELERSRRLVDSILETTPDIIYIYDLIEDRIAWSTHSVAAVLGYPTDVDIDDARLLQEALDPATLHARKEHSPHLDTSANGTVLEFEYRARDASGEWRWLSARETVFERTPDGRVARVLGAAQDVTERRQLLERLSRLALIDELTGLYNRHGFDTLAQQTVEHAARTGHRIGVLFCDLDNLKIINDTLGHTYGDRVIQAAAEALRTAMRSADVVARIGGDEFVVLAVETSPGGTQALRDRLRAVIERVNRRLDLPLPLDMSIGFAVCGTPETCRLQELIDAADANMYEQKHGSEGIPE